MRNSFWVQLAIVLLFVTLLSSCSMDDWFARKRNLNLLIWTSALPVCISLLSAITYYMVLQRNRPIRALASNSGWVMWYIVTSIINIITFLYLAPEMAMRSPRFEQWFSNYAGVFGLGLLLSILAFGLFCMRFWYWRRTSSVSSIPMFGTLTNPKH